MGSCSALILQFIFENLKGKEFLNIVFHKVFFNIYLFYFIHIQGQNEFKATIILKIYVWGVIYSLTCNTLHSLKKKHIFFPNYGYRTYDPFYMRNFFSSSHPNAVYDNTRWLFLEGRLLSFFQPSLSGDYYFEDREREQTYPFYFYQ